MFGFALDKEKAHRRESDKEIHDQQQAEQNIQIERRSHDHLQEIKHQQLPVHAAGFLLKHQHHLQVNQQVGDGQQLVFARDMEEIRHGKHDRQQRRQIRDRAI